MSPDNFDADVATPAPESRTRRHTTVLAGALLGAVTMTASVVGVSTIAGAQDDPAIDDGTAAEVDETDDRAWAAFDECFDTAVEDPAFGAKVFDEATESEAEAELTEAQWKALETQWQAAEDACFDLLPEDAKAAAEAFKAFDTCLADAGLIDDTDAAVVHVEDAETGQFIQFGELTGSVTITNDASGLSIVTDGDVTVIDHTALEAVYETCEQMLPADLYEFDEDDDWFDDEDDWFDDEDGS